MNDRSDDRMNVDDYTRCVVGRHSGVTLPAIADATTIVAHGSLH